MESGSACVFSPMWCTLPHSTPLHTFAYGWPGCCPGMEAQRHLCPLLDGWSIPGCVWSNIGWQIDPSAAAVASWLRSLRWSSQCRLETGWGCPQTCMVKGSGQGKMYSSTCGCQWSFAGNVQNFPELYMWNLNSLRNPKLLTRKHKVFKGILNTSIP